MKNEPSMIQSNYLSKAKYDYSTIEKRIIYHAILYLQSSIRNGISEDLFGQHLCFTIPIQQLKIADPNDNWARDYKKAAISLQGKKMDIPTEDGWIITGFINYAKFSTKTGLEIEISKFVVPHLTDLSKGFTALSALTALTLNSRFTQRMYEWCCQYNNDKSMWFELTPQEINELFAFKTPKVTGWLKQQVIDKSQLELKALFDKNESEIYFTYEEERGGKGRGGSIKKWKFKVHSNKDLKKKEKELKQNQSEDFAYVTDYFKKAWGIKQIDLINLALNKATDLNKINIIAERFKKINPRKVDNLGGYVRNILSEEFDITI